MSSQTYGAMIHIDNTDPDNVTVTLTDEVAFVTTYAGSNTAKVTGSKLRTYPNAPGGPHKDYPYAIISGGMTSRREDGSVAHYDLWDMVIEAARSQGVPIRVE